MLWRLLADQDRIVANEASLAFADAAGAAVETHRYPNLFHEMFLEPEAEMVLSVIAAWLPSAPCQTT